MSNTFKNLSVNNASVVRNDETLLENISCEINTQGITIIMGHNGAGKSLFLKMCHGQFSPQSGSVAWGGVPALDNRKSRSFVFQNTPLLRRSVFENVAYPLTVLGVSTSERRQRVNEALTRARLDDKAKCSAFELSGGEKQRMALARAWVTHPTAIIMDEPAASLDPASTKELEGILHDISNSGVKIFLATHDLMQAKRLADDVLMFAKGRIIAQEIASDFFDRQHEGAVADYLEGRL